MTNAQAVVAIDTDQADAGRFADHMIGLAIVAVLPAMFWSGMAYFAAGAFGYEMATQTVVGLALAIFTFLAGVWGSFALGAADRRRASA